MMSKMWASLPSTSPAVGRWKRSSVKQTIAGRFLLYFTFVIILLLVGIMYGESINRENNNAFLRHSTTLLPSSPLSVIGRTYSSQSHTNLKSSRFCSIGRRLNVEERKKKKQSGLLPSTTMITATGIRPSSSLFPRLVAGSASPSSLSTAAAAAAGVSASSSSQGWTSDRILVLNMDGVIANCERQILTGAYKTAKELWPDIIQQAEDMSAKDGGTRRKWIEEAGLSENIIEEPSSSSSSVSKSMPLWLFAKLRQIRASMTSEVDAVVLVRLLVEEAIVSIKDR
mmetsp:Transcript_8080/g.11318  ORF Transcript_8080/g.11318 Transcript_8080/m.11318 type:complete len:284 (-) Transcript_8080:30-881(-)